MKCSILNLIASVSMNASSIIIIVAVNKRSNYSNIQYCTKLIAGT